MRNAGLAYCGVLMLLIIGSFVTIRYSESAFAQSIDELREELQSRQDTLQSVTDRIKKFKEDIQLKKREARSLEDQIEIIEDTIVELGLSLEQTIAEIGSTDAEISAVQSDIAVKEEEIVHQKGLLAEYLRALYALNQQSSVTVFLKYTTFSEAVTEASTFEELQARGQQALMVVKQLRDELEQKQADLQEFKEQLAALQERQERQQATLASNRESKERVLSLTREQESEFQQLLQEAQRTHQSAESDIKRLDAQIREELRKQGIGKLPSVGILDWPIEAIFGVSCEFHCSGYPYEYLIGPHSGIDLPTNVGTPIRAPADGYVARAHDSGGAGYNYILLLHGDNVSTVYGHVSGFAVAEEQMVARGSIIGYTGGAPGTRGAGLSTGAHLHFEVRMDNVPINPRKFL